MLFAYLWFALFGVASAALCRHDWTLRDHIVNYLHPNAAMQKGVAVPEELRSAGQYFNAAFPGPLLDCYEDDDVEVVIHNELITQGTTVHWHGLHMNDKERKNPTPWADGTHRFSHAAILPGTSYTYRFKAYPAGSHWYHSHMDSIQVDRGVKGPIVIRKKQDPYAHLYDDERVLFLSDTRRVSEVCLKLEGQAMDVGNPVCNEVNKMSWNGVYGDGSDMLPYPQIEVEKGKCYRFRWIGAAGNTQNWQLKIAKHNMTLISLDGQDIEPLPVREFNLHTGERYDAIFCADQEPGNYLINATYDLACPLVHNGVGFQPGEQLPFIPLPPVDSCMFYAFIKYKGHDEVPKNIKPVGVGGGWPVGTGGGKDAPFPGKEAGIHFDLNNNEFGYLAVKNVEVMPEPEKADLYVTLYGGILGEDFKIMPGGHNGTNGQGQFGLPVQAGWFSPPDTKPFTKAGRTYLSPRTKPREFWSQAGKWPSTPSLFTQGKCGTNGANLITVPDEVEVLELLLVNLSPSAHVFHLHGMFFQVINYGFPDWCDYDHHNQCFFMPVDIGKVVAKETIGGEAISADPLHPNMGGPFFWGIKPSKDHPNYKKTLNLEHPLRKDMISAWRHQWAVVRVRPDNPGHWLLHCHMEQHVPTGMIIVLNVKPGSQPPIPADTPTAGNCPVHGWPHTAPPPPVKATSRLEVWNWVVDYQRPTREGPTWGSARLHPNMLNASARSSYILANGVFPGTKIEATEGDTLAIEIVNQAFGDPIAIHWHGQIVKDTPWSDGSADVTQGRIPADNNYTYQFTAGPAGTHFYVAHGDPLMPARGLKGALIVKPKTDTRAHEYSGEFLMQISDAWHEPESCLVQDGEQGNPKCAPIDKATFDGMFGDGSDRYPYPAYTVEEGKCYRVRMLGLMSQVPHFKLSIAGHDLTLLAVDGTEVAEVSVSSIMLHAGERYDFKLCANQPKGAYVITAEAPEFCDPAFLQRTGAPKPASCRFQAFLQYHSFWGKARIPTGKDAKGTGGGASPQALTTPPLDLGSWKDYSLIKPLECGPTLKPQADESFQVNLGRLNNGSMYLHTTNTPWKRPETPLLMTKGLKCADGVPIVNVPENATDIEVTIKNTLPDAHVVHLHGMQFQVLAMTEKNTGRHLVQLMVPQSPVLKDTVSIPAQGTATLRIIADNPGMWMLQDMSTTAQLRGAAMVFNVLPSKQPPVPRTVPTQGPKNCTRGSSSSEPDFLI